MSKVLKITPLSYIHSKPARVVAGLTCYTEFDSIYREMGW
jgi:hypothetical protein